jgi:hypothetical protein
MKPGGAGHVSSVRVRLLHASVRSRILKLVKERPDYYDVEKWGVPVSDLDCMATINTFSTSVIWLGLPRQGIWLRSQEIDDYLALWRLVAYYMGTPNEPFRDQAHGKAMMESLLASEIDPTDTGKILAHNIIIGLENTAPTYASSEFMEAMARHLNGDKLSDRLALAPTSLYYKALIYGYCFIVMVTCYCVRMIPPLDQATIEVCSRYPKIHVNTDNSSSAASSTILSLPTKRKVSGVNHSSSSSMFPSSPALLVWVSARIRRPTSVASRRWPSLVCSQLLALQRRWSMGVCTACGC